jgi:hypothetical protein
MIWLAQRRYGTYSSQSCYGYVNQARHKRAICFMAEPRGDVGAFVEGIESSWVCLLLHLRTAVPRTVTEGRIYSQWLWRFIPVEQWRRSRQRNINYFRCFYVGL